MRRMDGMSSFPLLLPDDRNVRAAAQAEVERAFEGCAARMVPERAHKVLAWAGPGNPPRPGDKLETEGQRA